MSTVLLLKESSRELIVEVAKAREPYFPDITLAWREKLAGEVLDVAVDLRPDSETFLHWHAEHLKAGDGRSLDIGLYAKNEGAHLPIVASLDASNSATGFAPKR